MGRDEVALNETSADNRKYMSWCGQPQMTVKVAWCGQPQKFGKINLKRQMARSKHVSGSENNIKQQCSGK